MEFNEQIPTIKQILLKSMYLIGLSLSKKLIQTKFTYHYSMNHRSMNEHICNVLIPHKVTLNLFIVISWDFSSKFTAFAFGHFNSNDQV